MSAPDDEPASPCVRVCTLDDDSVCIGCGRTVGEITGWSQLDHGAKRKILDRLASEARPAYVAVRSGMQRGR